MNLFLFFHAGMVIIKRPQSSNQGASAIKWELGVKVELSLGRRIKTHRSPSMGSDNIDGGESEALCRGLDR